MNAVDTKNCLKRYWLILVFGVMLVAWGCGQSAPNATTAPSPMVESPAPKKTEASDSILALTERCSAELRRRMEEEPSHQVVYVAVEVAANCTGYRYELEFRNAVPENVIQATSQGIPLAIERDDVEFLRGTTLDYLADPGGFVFENPRSNTSLLSEYRKLREEEARRRPVEEARAKRIDPQRAVADLRTPRRQEAFDDLQLWWKFYQPDVYFQTEETIHKVERYELAGGSQITVVLTENPDDSDLGIYLINDDGRQTPIFHGNNLIDQDDQFVDVTGDGIPEIVVLSPMDGRDEKNPDKAAWAVTSLDIIPITQEQVPLLRMVFDVRPYDARPAWRWSLVENPPGARDVVLEHESGGEWTERARFRWSDNDSRYEGPAGSGPDGFISRSGDIAPTQIEEFLKQRR